MKTGGGFLEKDFEIYGLDKKGDEGEEKERKVHFEDKVDKKE